MVSFFNTVFWADLADLPADSPSGLASVHETGAKAVPVIVNVVELPTQTAVNGPLTVASIAHIRLPPKSLVLLVPLRLTLFGPPLMLGSLAPTTGREY